MRIIVLQMSNFARQFSEKKKKKVELIYSFIQTIAKMFIYKEATIVQP